MTGKQHSMVVERLKDKKALNHEIIERAGYKAKNNHTRAQIYLENMKKPEIRSLLDNVVDEMEEVLTTTVRRYKDSNKLGEVQEATTNARWIHDKVRGKATQRIESQTTTVNLNLDLTSITSPEQV